MSETTETTTEGQTSADPTTSQTSSTTEQTTQQTTAETPFYESWSDELKNSQIVLRHKTPEDLARSLVAAERRLGVPADQLLRAPKGLDDKEGIGAIMKVLGAPDSADGYKLELGEGAGEADLAMAKDFAAFMHKETTAPPNVVSAALKWFSDQNAKFGQDQKAASEAALAAGEAALRQEWGAAYDTRAKEVGRLMNEYGGAELYGELETAGLANNPKLMSMFGKLLDRMAEPGNLSGNDRAHDAGALTPGQAKAKRLDLEADPIKSKALYDGSHPQHKDVVAERRRYLQLERGVTPGA